jgi:hypothetical protein
MRWITVLLLAVLVAIPIPASLYASETPDSDCDRWVIAIIPTPDGCTVTTQGADCQPPDGWEPLSGITYGEGQQSGVLLRRCVEK